MKRCYNDTIEKCKKGTGMCPFYFLGGENLKTKKWIGKVKSSKCYVILREKPEEKSKPLAFLKPGEPFLFSEISTGNKDYIPVIIFQNGEIFGYIRKENTIVVREKLSAPAETNKTIPEPFNRLAGTVALHPTWKINFKLLSESIDERCNNARTLRKKLPAGFPACYYHKDTETPTDAVVDFFVDERNGMPVERLFEFLDISAIEDNLTSRTAARNLLRDFYLNEKGFSSETGAVISCEDAFFTAAKESNVNVLVLIATAKIVLGKDGSNLSGGSYISPTGQDYTGIYSMFANGTEKVNDRTAEQALNFAYQHSWLSLYKSLIEGSRLLFGGNIKDKESLYTRTFSVNPFTDDIAFSFVFAKRLYNEFKKAEILEFPFEFEIPYSKIEPCVKRLPDYILGDAFGMRCGRLSDEGNPSELDYKQLLEIVSAYKSYIPTDAAEALILDVNSDAVVDAFDIADLARILAPKSSMSANHEIQGNESGATQKPEDKPSVLPVEPSIKPKPSAPSQVEIEIGTVDDPSKDAVITW